MGNLVFITLNLHSTKQSNNLFAIAHLVVYKSSNNPFAILCSILRFRVLKGTHKSARHNGKINNIYCIAHSRHTHTHTEGCSKFKNGNPI